MDTFSWFVGIFEGEGCVGSRRNKKTHKGYIYHTGGVFLTIKMTDEDTIAKCAEFLGVKYKEVPPSKPGYKPLYLVRKMGGKTGQLMDLLGKMKPHLSVRRQEQVERHIARAVEWGDTKEKADK